MNQDEIGGDVAELSAAEVRVLGCLVEKQLSTPDYYPMTLNALVAACNQSSNRVPVVSYDEATVRDAFEALRGHRLARVVHQPGQRAPKHRHVLDEAFAADDAEAAVLASLMLRGPQTAAELRSRTERMHAFESTDEVEATLERLTRRMTSPLVVHLERQPGQKESRWAHRLSGAAVPDAQAEVLAEVPSPNSMQVQLDALRSDVAVLQGELEALRSRLDG